MPIKAITGTPGAGKTLSALEELCKHVGVDPRDCKDSEDLIERLRKRENPRPVFVCNVEGLRPGIFEHLEDPLNWQDCPDGSLVLIDEAWQFMGAHTSEGRKDQRVLDLAKHRHRGFDFILTLQQPSQLSAFVRGLVGEHVHVSRKFGTDVTERFSWPAMCDDPNSIQQRKRGSGGIPWKYPKQVQGLYQSATVHTVKRKIPFRVLMLPVLGLLFLASLGFGAWKFKQFLFPAQPVPAAAAQRSEQPRAAQAKTEQVAQPAKRLTAEEWLEQQKPRVAEMPWSAPIFDNRPVLAEPRLFCYISGDQVSGECKCISEQGTKYTGLRDDRCRLIAKNGEPYNPYSRPGRILTTDSAGRSDAIGGGSSSSSSERVHEGASGGQGGPAARGVGDASFDGQQADYGAMRGFR